MEDLLWTVNYQKMIRQTADMIFFDIQKTEWNLPLEELGSFVKQTYSEIVEKFKELERTREYPAVRNSLYAGGCISGKRLGFNAGEGSTLSESCITHATGWSLHALLERQKENHEPFTLKLLIAGYR